MSLNQRQFSAINVVYLSKMLSLEKLGKGHMGPLLNYFATAYTFTNIKNIKVIHIIDSWNIDIHEAEINSLSF